MKFKDLKIGDKFRLLSKHEIAFKFPIEKIVPFAMEHDIRNARCGNMVWRIPEDSDVVKI